MNILPVSLGKHSQWYNLDNKLNEPEGVIPADILDTALQLYFQPPCVFNMIPGHDGGRNLAFLVKGR